jgi:N-acetylmuramoyl-L-alanine amidase
MPGVLIETGFLSNMAEESYLMSEEGQVYLASAIYRAFRDYKNGVESPASQLLSSAEKIKDQPPPPKTPAEKMTGRQDKPVDPVPVEKTVTKPPDPVTPGKPETKQSASPAGSSDSICFRVQFYTSPKKIPLNSQLFKGIQDAREYYHGGLYKYTTGNETTHEKASALCKAIRSKGFSDAFVVAFQNEIRITIDKAKQFISSGP